VLIAGLFMVSDIFAPKDVRSLSEVGRVRSITNAEDTSIPSYQYLLQGNLVASSSR
jgi:hypothetical protein